MTLQYLDSNDYETKQCLLPHQKLGLSFTRSGYGKKIPTSNLLRINGETRWRRIYCCIFSNIGTCYVVKNGEWLVVP